MAQVQTTTVLIVVVDVFMDLYPMPNQESRTIVEAIENCWFYQHGQPKLMLSDQGPNVDTA